MAFILEWGEILKPMKIVLCSENPLYARNLANALENNISFQVTGTVPEEEMVFYTSASQPDIVLWEVSEYKKYSSRLKQIRFCCPAAYLFILTDNPGHTEITTMLDMEITACLPTMLSPAQIANAVELSIDAGLMYWGI